MTEPKITFAYLSQTNRRIRVIEDTQLLYEGGTRLEDHAARFLPMHPQEADQNYAWRLHYFAYENHFGHIINAIVAQIFENQVGLAACGPEPDGDDHEASSEPPSNPVLDALNNPECGNFGGVLRDVTTQTLVHEEAFARWEINELGEPRFEALRPTAVLKYHCDKQTGGLRQVMVREKIEDEAVSILVAKRFYVRFELYEWLADDKTQLTTFRTDLMEEGPIDAALGIWDTGSDNGKHLRRMKDAKILPPEVEVLPHAMPILRFELGKNILFGADLMIAAKSLLRDSSSIDSATQRCLNPVAIAYLGPDMTRGKMMSPAIDDGTRMDAPREAHDRRGVAVYSSEDEVEYLEARGDVITAAYERTKTRVDGMYQRSYQTAQMVVSLEAGASKSGAAKALDLKEKNIIVSFIATSLKIFAGKFAAQLLLAVFPALPKKADGKPGFEIHGLDFSSDMQDRDGTIAEMSTLGVLAMVLKSKTFVTKYLAKQLEKLLDGMADSDEVEAMIAEIEVGFDQQAAQSMPLEVDPRPDIEPWTVGAP